MITLLNSSNNPNCINLHSFKGILVIAFLLFCHSDNFAQVAYRQNFIYAQIFQNGPLSSLSVAPDCPQIIFFPPRPTGGDYDYPAIPSNPETGTVVVDESFDIGGTRATCWAFPDGFVTAIRVWSMSQITNLHGFYFEIGHVTMDGRFVTNSKATYTFKMKDTYKNVIFEKIFNPYTDWNKFYVPIPPSLQNIVSGGSYYFEIVPNANDANASNVFRLDDIAIIGTANCQQTVKLGNYVWEDTNGNGTADSGESPIAGVKVALYADDGDGVFEPQTNPNIYENGKDAYITTTTTDAAGHYQFTTVPGNYFVAVVSDNFSGSNALASYYPTAGSPVAGNSDLDNKDHAITRTSYRFNGVASDLVTLALGGEPTNDGDDANGNQTIDFGFQKYNPANVVNLGNLVWLEANEDGLYNPADGEAGIDGVKVELYEDTDNSGTFSAGDAVVAQTITAGGGLYNFTGLQAGNYVVVLPTSNYSANGGALKGLKVTTGLNPVPDPDNNTDNDNNGSLLGYKVAAQAITLSLGGEPSTDGDGTNGNLTVDFGFTNPICSRAYNVKSNLELQVIEGSSIKKTVVLQNNIMGSTTHTIVDVEEGPGNTVYAITQGVFPDENDGNKQYHLIKYNLSDGSATVVYSDDRNENGLSRNLRSLAVGKGKVYILKAENAGSFPSNSFKFITYDIASNTTSSSSEIVYRDPSYHAAPAFNYTYLEYYKGKLYTAAYEYYSYVGYLMSFTTDGNFTLNTSNVAYNFAYTSYMAIRQDSIYRYTTDSYAPVDVFKASDLSAITPFSPVNPLGSFAYNQVYAYNGGWLGRNPYLNDLSYAPSPTVWPASSNWQVLNTGTSNTVYWAKNCESSNSSSGPGGTLALGNYIWKDDNNNGTVDSGEIPIANVAVDLYMDNGDGTFNPPSDILVQSTTTSGTGNYQFTDLPADNYFVRVTPTNFGSGNPLSGLITSTGFTPSIDDVDNVDHGIDSQDPNQFGIVCKMVTLTENGEPDTAIDGDDTNGNQTIDFGFYNPPSILNLGNLVWNDKNNNLLVDAGELPIADVIVDLYLDFNGNGMLDLGTDMKVGSETTDGSGHYLFSNLAAGDYIVYIPPSNYGLGKPLNGMINSIRFTGGNFNIDNADHGVEEIVADQTVSGVASTVITLANGTEPTSDGDDENGNLTMDFGFFVPLNLDAGEIPIANVAVNLIVDDGDGIYDVNKDLLWLIDSTDTNGLYEFNQLGAGKYFVQIPFDNFSVGSSLNALFSSNGSNNGNSDLNEKDHGVDDANFLTKGIFSTPVDLAAGTEPNTAVDGDGTNGNLTIDFGFTNQQTSSCTMSISATPGTCNTTNNQYSVTGSLTFTNQPTTGTLSVAIGAVSQSFNLPFSSPQTFTLSGLTADGASHTVIATFSTDATCSDTISYTAPQNCLPSVCSVNLSATPGLCNSSNNQYTLTGNLNFTNPPSTGTMTITVSGGSQTYNIPFPTTYSISGLTADGTSHTVTVVFSADANCTNTATYTAPTSCGCNNTPYSICPGESYTLTAQSGYQNYQWYTVSGTTETPIAGATSQNYVVTATGIYKWKAQDGNACPVEACCQYEFVSGNCATCSITNGGLVVLNCDNKGTLTNSNDDTYSFTLNPTGSLLSTSYTISGLPDGNKTFNYGSSVTLGPYIIQSGVQNVTITDNSDINCKFNVSIQPPQTCSNCIINPPALSIIDNVCSSRTGSINVVQGCGVGTTIEYSINNGLTWTKFKPIYSTTSLMILARCVNDSDTSCKSTITSITTNPIKCTPSTNSNCQLISNATIDPCNDNKTGDLKSDDFFTIQINASVSNGGSSNKYEVVNGADPSTGLGGNLLNSGGTTYGSPVTVGNTKIFKADGLTSYQLVVRDINNNNCYQLIDIAPVAPCSLAPPKSPCYPVPCVPIGVIKN